MNIQKIKAGKVIYVKSDRIIVTSEQDILDLMGETGFQDLIIHDYNFQPSFFDLSTKTLGFVLQKLTNYRVRLAIIGDFKSYQSKVLADFICESNRQNTYVFLTSLEDVKKVWDL